MNSAGKKLKQAIEEKGIVTIPGAYDALSAKMIELAGFEGVYVTGCGLHGSQLAVRDMDLLTLTEIADTVRRICAAVNVPVMADAESGFGDAVNVARAVHLYEDAGVAALQLDDEVIPCKCPFLYPNVKQELISVKEMCKKIEAAAATRKDEDTLIVVRSDTQGSVYDSGDNSHLKEQIYRLNEYSKAGADCVFPIALNYEDYKRVLNSVDAKYKLCCVSQQLQYVPGYDLDQYLPEDYHRDMGCNIYIAPLFTLTVCTKAMQDTLTEFRKTLLHPAGAFTQLNDYNKLLTEPGWLKLSKDNG